MSGETNCGESEMRIVLMQTYRGCWNSRIDNSTEFHVDVLNNHCDMVNRAHSSLERQRGNNKQLVASNEH